jgi:hypothetical protein
MPYADGRRAGSGNLQLHRNLSHGAVTPIPRPSCSNDSCCTGRGREKPPRSIDSINLYPGPSSQRGAEAASARARAAGRDASGSRPPSALPTDGWIALRRCNTAAITQGPRGRCDVGKAGGRRSAVECRPLGETLRVRPAKRPGVVPPAPRLERSSDSSTCPLFFAPLFRILRAWLL